MSAGITTMIAIYGVPKLGLHNIAQREGINMMVLRDISILETSRWLKLARNLAAYVVEVIYF